MSDILSKMLSGVLGGGSQGGSSPLGTPRMPGDQPGAGGGLFGGAPGLGGGLGGLGGMLGGGAGAGMGGGLGGLLGGLLGGARGGSPMGGMGGGMGGGVKGMALMALLAYMMRGQGGVRGLSSLTDQLRGAGLGNHVDSWVGPGGNQAVDPEDLARAIPPDALADMESHTGMGRSEILSELSRGLPQMVDRLTPHGRMPDRDDELPDADPDHVMGGFGFGRDPRA
jgi:uncharacterized protein YidB (DUF937 family)